MSLRTLLQNVSIDTVTILQSDYTRSGLDVPTFSGVKFDTDGNQYARQNGGGWSSLGAWLIKGTASDYYVQTNLDSGGLTTDAGDGVQITTDRIYDTQDSAPLEGGVAATVTFELSTDAPGSTVVAGPTTLVFLADHTLIEE